VRASPSCHIFKQAFLKTLFAALNVFVILNAFVILKVFVILNLFQDNASTSHVILKQVQDDEWCVCPGVTHVSP
jgi:hypothetical protein